MAHAREYGVFLLLFLVVTTARAGSRDDTSGVANMAKFFSRNPEAIVAPADDDVSFECSLKLAAERIQWLHGGRPVAQGVHGGRSSSLEVRLKGEHQVGDYQCVAWFGASALTSLPARLTLAELQPFPLVSPQTFEVTAGNTVALHCPPPFSMPPAGLQYYKNGQRLSVSVLESTGTLILPNISLQDAGTYHCTATNYLLGRTVTAPYTLTLAVKANSGPVPPRFLTLPNSEYTVRTGNNVSLECCGVGSPIPTTTWEKYGGQLQRDRVTMLPGVLHLAHVTRADEGSYICTHKNGVGSPLRHTIKLLVQEPPVIEKMPAEVFVDEEGEVKLDCQVKGSPAPQLTWVFNGEPVVPDNHIKMYQDKLVITKVEKRHAGNFQCFATNPLGTVSGLCMLHVLPKLIQAQAGATDSEGAAAQEPVNTDDVPPTPITWNKRKDSTRKRNGKKKDKHKGNDVMIPPTRPNVTRLSDTSVMVRWDVPRNNGMSIQFFKVQYRELSKGRRKGGARIRGGAGEGSRWMTSNEDIPPHIRSYEVDNLHTDCTYRFRIAAAYVNDDNKLGPNSARFHLHRGNNNALTPPKLIRTEALSPSCIQIHWQYTSSARVPVEGFYIYYRAASTAGDYIQASVEGENHRSFNITYLQADTAYEMKVQSFTVDSASNFSAILTQKTLPLPTETPPVTKETNPNVGKVELPNNQMYVVLGAVLGGLALLATVVLGVFLCNRHRANSNHSTQGSGEHQDKFSDPGLQMESGNVFALNSKTLLNGRMQQNGFLRSSKMNITSNPLAESDEDKNQNMVEMTSQNNNCDQDSGEAGASCAGEGETRIDSDAKNWCGTAPSASNIYV